MGNVYGNVSADLTGRLVVAHQSGDHLLLNIYSSFRAVFLDIFLIRFVGCASI